MENNPKKNSLEPNTPPDTRPASGYILATLRNPGFHLMIYTLLRDVFFLLLIALGLFFTAESILPGFAVARFNFPLFVTLAVALATLLIVSESRLKVTQTEASPQAKPPRFVIFIVLWVIILTINSLIAFPWWAIITILILLATILAPLLKSPN